MRPCNEGSTLCALLSLATTHLLTGCASDANSALDGAPIEIASSDDAGARAHAHDQPSERSDPQDGLVACEDQRLDSSEACDSSTGGADTWHCSSDCRARRIYVTCEVPGSVCSDGDAGEFGTRADCSKLAEDAPALCLPATGLGLDLSATSLDVCPSIEGPYTQALFSNFQCVIACEIASDTGEVRGCPPQLPRCIPNPFREASPLEADHLCVP